MNDKLTEYEVREIDQYGDCVDVNFFAKLSDARNMAAKLGSWIIERHTTVYAPKDDIYERIDFGGDVSHLASGGWIDEEE